MIPTIDTLEKEINDFHSNISGSNELLKMLSEIAGQTKAQSELFETKTSELLSGVERMTAETKDSFDQESKKLVDEIRTEHDKQYSAFISRLDKINVEQLLNLCQDIQKTTSKKLSIAIGCSAAALIVAIASLILFLVR